MDLKNKLRAIENFPKQGIKFIDITTVLQDGTAFKYTIDKMIEACYEQEMDFDVVLGAESRGFIFATPLAIHFNKGFVPVRKKGKLPYETISESYDLEYGKAEIEIHIDAIKPGQKVLLVDDLLATGGTTEAMIRLVEKAGGVVGGILYCIELGFLNGREKFKDYKMHSVVVY